LGYIYQINDSCSNPNNLLLSETSYIIGYYYLEILSDSYVDNIA